MDGRDRRLPFAWVGGCVAGSRLHRGGWFAFLLVPIIGATVLLLLRRPWAALAFVLAVSRDARLSSPLLKWFFGRARPEDILVQVRDRRLPVRTRRASAASLAVALALLIGALAGRRHRGRLRGPHVAEPHLPRCALGIGHPRRRAAGCFHRTCGVGDLRSSDPLRTKGPPPPASGRVRADTNLRSESRASRAHSA